MGLVAKSNGKPAAGTKSSNNEYRGVQVVINKNKCCAAAVAIADQRFLIEQVPKLPLAICDAAQCGCGYERFDDRRTDLRRASDVAFDMASQLHDDDNRSSPSSGRRDDD